MKSVKSNTACIWLVFCVVVVMHSTLVSSEIRKHYIAAVERKWDYAPSGYNNVKGVKLEDDRLVRYLAINHSLIFAYKYQNLTHTITFEK